MGTTMNKQAYEKMIAEDLEWLAKQPRSLERDHIEYIVKGSVEHLYPTREQAESSNCVCEYCQQRRNEGELSTIHDAGISKRATREHKPEQADGLTAERLARILYGACLNNLLSVDRRGECARYILAALKPKQGDGPQKCWCGISTCVNNQKAGSHASPNPGSQAKIRELESRLIEINRLIYAAGAPLGSETYFAIRKIAAEVEQGCHERAKPNNPAEACENDTMQL